eukprot:g16278.t1
MIDVTDGTVVWRYQESASDNGSVASYASAARADGSIVLAGLATGDWFGELAGPADFAAAAMGEDGQEPGRWQGGQAPGSDVVYGVALLPDGSVVLAGQTTGDFTGADWHVGGAEFAIVKLTADRKQNGCGSDNDFRDVAVRPTDGASFLVGWTQGYFVDGTINMRNDAAVLIETGAESFTPAPVVAAQPAAPVPGSSSCGVTESFQITSSDLPTIDGCYQATTESYGDEGADTAIWSVRGTFDAGQILVVGMSNDGAAEYDDTPWSISYFGGEEEEGIWYYWSFEGSATVHPADPTWACKNPEVR